MHNHYGYYVLCNEVLKLEWSWWYICKNVEVKFTIAPAITKLFNMSIQVENIDWKSSLVVPITKKGDHSNLSKYSPIFPLPVLSTVLEHHMSILLYHHPSTWAYTHLH